MIKLTGLDHKEIYINADHIEKLESIPDSVITLTNGRKYLVEESNDEIIKRFLKYKKELYCGETITQK